MIVYTHDIKLKKPKRKNDPARNRLRKQSKRLMYEIIKGEIK
jgi:hypothetical protein